MCSVCDASDAITESQGGSPLALMRHALPGLTVFVLNAQATEPEFKPFRVLIRRFTGQVQGLPELFEGNDLAGFLGILGTDIKWRSIHPDMQSWLHVGGEDPERLKPYRRFLDPLDPTYGGDAELTEGVRIIQAYTPAPAPAPAPAKGRKSRKRKGAGLLQNKEGE